MALAKTAQSGGLISSLAAGGVLARRSISLSVAERFSSAPTIDTALKIRRRRVARRFSRVSFQAKGLRSR
jgi:hypothetical protein